MTIAGVNGGQRLSAPGRPNFFGMVGNGLRGLLRLMLAGNPGRALATISEIPQWIATSGPGRSPLVDEVPWLVNQAVDFLRTNLSGHGRIFEWGSGGSTLFFAARSVELATVEHDESWFEQMSELIEDRNFAHVDIRFFPPEMQRAEYSAENPERFASTAEGYRFASFEAYVQAIDDYPNDYFELVSIDGRARVACMKHAIRHVAPGGWLLLDNSDRTVYLADIPEALLSWSRQDFLGPVNYSGAFGMTTLWQRPCGHNCETGGR